MNQPLIIRADASTEIGTGHTMRCLSLAQAWKDAFRGHAVFVMAMESPVLEDRLRSEGIGTLHLSAQPGSDDDAIKTASLAQQRSAPWVVIDGYHFDANYQQIIKESDLRLLAIDDIGKAKHYYADIVLNQNLHAHEDLYENREDYTQLLLGTRYVLLRREFWKWRGWKRQISQVARKVLVTLGGGDPDKVTLKVIQALQQVEIDGLEAEVVVGGGGSNYAELQAVVCDSRFPIRLKSNVTNMPELMAWADVAIAGGGTTSWEMAFMGLPEIVLILAENQRPIAEQLGRVGVAKNLGWYKAISNAEIAQAVNRLLLSVGARTEMAYRAQELVDGEGMDRVLAALVGN
jgi:UDP-2,4-diacetamido-2,4,6-trideoxy-beta-L-altropyranose hydrolase